MAIVIRYMCCLVFISRSSDLIQYGGIVTKANTYSASQRHPRSAHTHSSRPSDNALRNARLHAALTSIYHASYRPARQYITQCNMGTEQLSTSRHNLSCRHRGL